MLRCLYLSRSKNARHSSHRAQNSRLWMRIQNKDWWDVVLLHFIDTEQKESFMTTGH